MKLIAFLISIIFFVGGLWLIGQSFYVPGGEYFVFLGGILASCLGIAIPIHVLKRVDA